jgi:hypothetical protein
VLLMCTLYAQFQDLQRAISLYCTCGRAGVECATAWRTNEEKSCSDEASMTARSPFHHAPSESSTTWPIGSRSALRSSHFAPLASCTCTSPRRIASVVHGAARGQCSKKRRCARLAREQRARLRRHMLARLLVV